MLIKINEHTGLMYLYFSAGVQNIQMPTGNEEVSKFVAKSNKEQIVGYEIENFEKNMNLVLSKLGLSAKQKLAVVLCYIREKSKKTQKEFSQMFNISEGTYKTLEKAEHNISFDTLSLIFCHLPQNKNFIDKIFTE
ncbi:MAG: helix-turn-helix domain-containing protein [Oligoflexia bacterium]|nr:helix-turn-helix domain-containing protein [Oligoflexia bacterium]